MVNPYDQVVALINAHYEKDDTKFNSLAMFIAEEYSKTFNESRANEIKQALGIQMKNYITRTDEVKNYEQTKTIPSVHRYYRELPNGTDIEITKEEFDRLKSERDYL